MNPILCDTNVFILYFLGNANTSNALHQIGNENIFIPSIALMELIRGCGDRKAQIILENRLKTFLVAHVNEAASKMALELIKRYHLSHSLSIPDAFIAACALEYNMELYTYNVKDFQFIPGIRLYQPA